MDEVMIKDLGDALVGANKAISNNVAGERYPKCEHSEVIKMTLLYVFVCSKLPQEEALVWVQDAFPAGTSNNWQINSAPAENQKPIACANGGGRTHYQFTC